jgi:preprotein translocase subunit SecA
MSFLDKILGDPNAKIIKSLEPTISKINSLEPEFLKLSDEELKNKTVIFKERLAKGESLDDILPEAFATVREASRRLLGKRHYDVQLIGGIILHRGQIAEMKTGEGKTLVATLPLYLNALEGKGVHLVTVNDYLSRVGAGWMAPVYHALGLTTSVIVHDEAYTYDPEHTDDSQFDDRLKHFKLLSRRDAYRCDITYGTNNEFGFDYLKDNMVASLDQTVQRPLHYSIVDEIDSILIDEARTPLIISSAAEESTDKYFKFSELVERLIENEDYNVDEKQRAVTLTENGLNKMEKLLGVENIYVAGGIKDVHHIEQALKARVLFRRDRDYVIRDDEIVIVDEFTGRMMPGRRYSEGLHQAIEAKERVKVQKESQTMATITFQNLFRIYKKLAGMTGTAVTEAEEFHKIYNLETIVIPTNRPNIRKDDNDHIYRTEEDKFAAVIRDVKERHEKGQPVLIGTISIEKNEVLAEMMEREGLHPQMLNAKNHQREAEIISQAGHLGAITLATNMAGRGVDIILGGNPELSDTEGLAKLAEEQKKVVELGGLHVIGTERHESRRIDNQLRGRAGRQGDPGSSRFYVSTEDDLMRIFGGDRMKNAMKMLNVPADMPIESKIISKSVESAQKKVEGNNFDMRKHLVEYDDVINKHREAIYRRRREILEIAENVGEHGDRTLSDIIMEYIRVEIEKTIDFNCVGDVKDWNLNEVLETIRTIFEISAEESEKIMAIAGGTGHDIKHEIVTHINELAKSKYDFMVEGFKKYGVEFKDVEKGILIRSIDQLWIEHLETIDYLRGSIGLRGYGQRDPLVEYKKEAFRMFHELNDLIRGQVVYSIYKTGESINLAPEILLSLSQEESPKNLKFAGAIKEATDNPHGENIDVIHEKMKTADGEKVGRNDPCPCGSGKKYKNCHGK